MYARAVLMLALLAAMSVAPTIARAQVLPGTVPFSPLAGDAPGRRVELPQWRPLPAPSFLYPAAVYDPRRHRVIAFGSSNEFPSDYAVEELMNRTWELSLDGASSWREVVPRGPLPSARRGHTAIYDPIRDRLLVFGGGTSALGGPPYLNDVWSLSLSGEPVWTRLEIAGASPPPRTGHCAIYDPIHDAMLVFGSDGGGGYEAPLNDTWSLSLSGAAVWSKLEPTGPVPPARPGDAYEAVFDPRRRRIVLIGRVGTSGLDAWALSLTGIPTWNKLAPSGSSPAEWWDHACAYDPDGDRVVILGGYRFSVHRTAVWELPLADGGGWKELEPVGTPPRERIGEVVMYVPRGHRMIMLGGWASPRQGMDTWALELKGPLQWSAVSGGGPLPHGREAHTAVYDSRLGRMVIYGGESRQSHPYSIRDVYVLSLNDDPHWTPLNPKHWSPHPEAGRGHSAIYDPIRGRMLVFGGITDEPDSPNYVVDSKTVNEVWSFDLSGEPLWSKIEAAGDGPPPLAGHLAIYDPDGDRMVVFGGRDSSLTVREDVWALSLAEPMRWTKLTPAQRGPIPGYSAHGVHDPEGRRLLVAGSGGDTWALSLVGSPTWSKLTLPARPSGHLIYDPKDNRLVVWDGSRCWALVPSGRQEWTEIGAANEPPPARSGESVIYDPQNEQVVVFGGREDMNDAWALSMKTKSDPVRELARSGAPASLVLSPPAPNPAAGEVLVGFALPQAGRASLAVFDAAGRRVRKLAEGAFGPGRHSLKWDGRDAEGHLAPIGLYFMRLESRGQSITQKTVIAR